MRILQLLGVFFPFGDLILFLYFFCPCHCGVVAWMHMLPPTHEIRLHHQHRMLPFILSLYLSFPIIHIYIYIQCIFIPYCLLSVFQLVFQIQPLKVKVPFHALNVVVICDLYIFHTCSLKTMLSWINLSLVNRVSMHHPDKSSALKNVWIHVCMCVLLIQLC